ncbi:hypothetical protein ACFTAO_30270 [Paenibacillus rhizoplanae]
MQKATFSSANDLAVLTAYAMHNPVFKEIVATKEKTADNPYEKWDYKWSNKKTRCCASTKGRTG